MKGKMMLTSLGLVMIVLSLSTLTAGTDRAIGAQCRTRCNCSAGPCGSITKCQDETGWWTKCCEWCSS